MTTETGEGYGLNDGSCIRLRPLYRNHVWTYDFIHTRTRDGRKMKILTILDEYTRECLSIDVKRRFTSDDVLYRLTNLFITNSIPDHIRSNNGSEFTAKVIRTWLIRLGLKTSVH